MYTYKTVFIHSFIYLFPTTTYDFTGKFYDYNIACLSSKLANKVIVFKYSIEVSVLCDVVWKCKFLLDKISLAELGVKFPVML